MTYFLDLFSGIGGFALGASWAGLRFDDHFFSEVDDYATRVYSLRFPDAKPLGDIRAIRGADLPQGDWIIAGGFPCQDISVAGKGAGLAGARSGLWYEYARLIGELRPRFAIMENVGALAFRGLDSVLGSLAALGYDAEWQDIRASDVGAPHRRERLWIVAYPEGMECTTGAEERSAGAEIMGDRRTCDNASGSGSASIHVADATSSRRDGGTREEQYLFGSSLQAARPGDGGNVADADSESKRRATKPRSECGKWLPESGFCRVAHGIPARVDRLKCLGNSIVPQIAELIFREIARL